MMCFVFMGNYRWGRNILPHYKLIFYYINKNENSSVIRYSWKFNK